MPNYVHLKVNFSQTIEPKKRRRRKWVRYERTYSDDTVKFT